MTTTSNGFVLRPAPGLRWVLDAGLVTIVPDDGPTHILTGLDAAIWGWIAAGVHAQLVEFVARVTDAGPEEAAYTLAACFNRWLELGILVPASRLGADHG